MKSRYCTNCGSEIPSGAAFCPYCGHAVSFDREEADAPLLRMPKTRGVQSAVLLVVSALSLSPVAFCLGVVALLRSRQTRRAMSEGLMEQAEDRSAKSLKMLRWGVLFLVLHWLFLSGIFFLHTKKTDNVGWQSREMPTAQAEVGTAEEEPEELSEKAGGYSLRKRDVQAPERKVEAQYGTGEKAEKGSKKSYEEASKEHPTSSKQSPTLSKQSPTLLKQDPTLSVQNLRKEKEASISINQHETREAEDRAELEKSTKTFDFVEQPPVFPGGGDASLLKWIHSHLRYPTDALENGIQGTVLLRFVVTSTGEVGDVQILKSVDTSLDREAVRLIKELPKFQPGRQSGKPVNVWFQVPIRFQIQ